MLTLREGSIKHLTTAMASWWFRLCGYGQEIFTVKQVIIEIYVANVI